MRTKIEHQRIWTLEDIEEAVTRKGSHWFAPSTMSFFDCKLYGDLVFQGRKGIFFVSSEKGPDGVRKYSVREFEPECSQIITWGEFQGYETKSDAAKAARRASEGLS